MTSNNGKYPQGKPSSVAALENSQSCKHSSLNRGHMAEPSTLGRKGDRLRLPPHPQPSRPRGAHDPRPRTQLWLGANAARNDD